MFDRHFTVEQVNALLPELCRLLEAIRSCRDRLAVDWQEAAPVLRQVRMNGGGKEVAPFVRDLQGINTTLRAFAELGVRVKDLEGGLVDFPSWREGREVFLSWKLGESEVRYWHEIGSGFADRQALEMDWER